ncbi:MAG TPA: hypothetical protein VFN38_07185 [Gemmatimonadaceae bacterium]|nr:hypothetical protein [Gemmatimonadaceae bacterium]
MTALPHRALSLALAIALVASPAAGAQWGRSPLPRSRADVLLDAGLWPQAEEAYYAQSRVRPRAPAPRAALGRYLAMKGAVLPGTILIEEALKFGLDSTMARALLKPWKSVMEWRAIATIRADSVVRVRPPRDSTALFQLPLPPRPAADGTPRTSYRDTVWADVVPRLIGSDSLYTRSPRVGLELIEALVPSLDTATMRLTLHADAKSANRSTGLRFPLLRDAKDVRVLMTSGRILSLPAALRELAPKWWQVDLLHGMLIVR